MSEVRSDDKGRAISPESNSTKPSVQELRQLFFKFGEQNRNHYKNGHPQRNSQFNQLIRRFNNDTFSSSSSSISANQTNQPTSKPGSTILLNSFQGIGCHTTKITTKEAENSESNKFSCSNDAFDSCRTVDIHPLLKQPHLENRRENWEDFPDVWSTSPEWHPNAQPGGFREQQKAAEDEEGLLWPAAGTESLELAVLTKEKVKDYGPGLKSKNNNKNSIGRICRKLRTLKMESPKNDKLETDSRESTQLPTLDDCNVTSTSTSHSAYLLKPPQGEATKHTPSNHQRQNPEASMSARNEDSIMPSIEAGIMKSKIGQIFMEEALSLPNEQMEDRPVELSEKRQVTSTTRDEWKNLKGSPPTCTSENWATFEEDSIVQPNRSDTGSQQQAVNMTIKLFGGRAKKKNVAEEGKEQLGQKISAN